MEPENKDSLNVHKAFLGNKTSIELPQLEDRGYTLKECAILASKIQQKRDDGSWWVGKRGSDDYIYVRVLGNVDAPKWYVHGQMIYPEIGPKPDKLPFSFSTVFSGDHYTPYIMESMMITGCKDCGERWSFESNSSPVEYPEITIKCWKCLGVH